MKFYYKKILILVTILYFSCENESQRNLKEIVDGVNKKCPKMIDSETKFDGIDFIEPNGLKYKYTLSNLDLKNIDTLKFKRALFPGILSTIKISSEMKKIRDEKVMIVYDYFDKFNQHICTFKITEKDYN